MSKVLANPPHQSGIDGTVVNLRNNENWSPNDETEVPSKNSFISLSKTQKPSNHLSYPIRQTSNTSPVGSPIIHNSLGESQVSPTPISLEKIQIRNLSTEHNSTRSLKNPRLSPSPQQSSFRPPSNSRLKPTCLFSQSPSKKKKA